MVEEHDVHPPYLSNEEKHLLFRDGYVVIKNCIPKRLTNPAKEVIYGNLDNISTVSFVVIGTVIGLSCAARLYERKLRIF